MKIVNIVKSTAVSDVTIPGQPQAGKTKYFLDHMDASFHIQTRASAFQFKIEPCIAILDGSEYYAATKAAEKTSDGIMNLAANTTHQAYLNSVSDGNDKDEYDTGTYTNYITVGPKPSYISSHDTIFIDENRTIYWVGEKISIQKVAPEFEAISPSISRAITNASQRQRVEYQHAATLFAQRKLEFERAKLELELKQADFDLEAAALALKWI